LKVSAPEYRYNGKFSLSADQFPLSALLYERLTGKQPYGSGYSKATVLNNVQRLKYTLHYETQPTGALLTRQGAEKTS
jgi:protein phosphatase